MHTEGKKGRVKVIIVIYLVVYLFLFINRQLFTLSSTNSTSPSEKLLFQFDNSSDLNLKSHAAAKAVNAVRMTKSDLKPAVLMTNDDIIGAMNLAEEATDVKTDIHKTGHGSRDTMRAKREVRDISTIGVPKDQNRDMPSMNLLLTGTERVARQMHPARERANPAAHIDSSEMNGRTKIEGRATKKRPIAPKMRKSTPSFQSWREWNLLAIVTEPYWTATAVSICTNTSPKHAHAALFRHANIPKQSNLIAERGLSFPDDDERSRFGGSFRSRLTR
mmetsp:Transcript_18268/g.30026  ORF Transcript_18268/g.30026 Transcript_18268/m.30026 type:complete len:276 (+) Transcript_18268:30-857(+)